MLTPVKGAQSLANSLSPGLIHLPCSIYILLLISLLAGVHPNQTELMIKPTISFQNYLKLSLNYTPYFIWRKELRTMQIPLQVPLTFQVRLYPIQFTFHLSSRPESNWQTCGLQPQPLKPFWYCYIIIYRVIDNL
jgi:hypothetical protein